MECNVGDSENYAFRINLPTKEFIEYLRQNYTDYNYLPSEGRVFLIPMWDEYEMSWSDDWVYKEMITVEDKEVASFMKIKDILQIDFITYIKELRKLD